MFHLIESKKHQKGARQRLFFLQRLNKVKKVMQRCILNTESGSAKFLDKLKSKH